MKGITAYGVYLPRLRLNRQAMVEANAWFDSSLKGLGRGERSICNWDEDTITMAVEAGIDCLSALQEKTLSGLNLASTTAPFVDRQKAQSQRPASTRPPKVCANDLILTKC